MWIEQLQPATTVVSAESAANTANATLISIAPGAGLSLYIVAFTLDRLNSSATAITVTAIELTTTLTGPTGGPLTWSTGILMAAGDTRRDADLQPCQPIKCATGTTVVLNVPAGGAGIRYRANMAYFIAP